MFVLEKITVSNSGYEGIGKVCRSQVVIGGSTQQAKSSVHPHPLHSLVSRGRADRATRSAVELQHAYEMLLPSSAIVLKGKMKPRGT